MRIHRRMHCWNFCKVRTRRARFSDIGIVLRSKLRLTGPDGLYQITNLKQPEVNLAMENDYVRHINDP